MQNLTCEVCGHDLHEHIKLPNSELRGQCWEVVDMTEFFDHVYCKCTGYEGVMPDAAPER